MDFAKFTCIAFRGRMSKNIQNRKVNKLLKNIWWWNQENCDPPPAGSYKPVRKYIYWVRDVNLQMWNICYLKCYTVCQQHIHLFFNHAQTVELISLQTVNIVASIKCWETYIWPFALIPWRNSTERRPVGLCSAAL